MTVLSSGWIQFRMNAQIWCGRFVQDEQEKAAYRKDAAFWLNQIDPYGSPDGV